MRNFIQKTVAAILLTGALATVHTTFAQSVDVTTTTSSAGVISQFGSDQMIITSESSPSPLSYTYSKTTTYVDENGVPVSVETVKSGVPVTVYYTKVGNTLLADKVIVRKAVIVTPSAVEEKKTTTTTTTDK